MIVAFLHKILFKTTVIPLHWIQANMVEHLDVQCHYLQTTCKLFLLYDMKYYLGRIFVFLIWSTWVYMCRKMMTISSWIRVAACFESHYKRNFFKEAPADIFREKEIKLLFYIQWQWRWVSSYYLVTLILHYQLYIEQNLYPWACLLNIAIGLGISIYFWI